MKSNEIKRDFIGMFDVLKGHIMFWIIFIHSLRWVMGITPDNLNAFGFGNKFFMYNLVPMCILFILIGYSFKPEEDLKKHFMKMVRIYFSPYALTSIGMVAFYVISELFKGHIGLGTITSPVLGAIFGISGNVHFLDKIWITGINNMWFLVAAFIGECIYNLLFKIRNNKVRITVVFLISIAATFIPDKQFFVDNFKLVLPWMLQTALITPAIFETGYWLKNTKFFYKKSKPIVYWISIAVAFGLWLYAHINWTSEFSTGVLTCYFADVLVGIISSVVIMSLYLKLKVPFWPITLPSEFVGRYSLWVLCAHALGTKITDLYYSQFEGVMIGLMNSSCSPWVVTLLLYIFNLIISAILFIIIYKLGNSNFKSKLKRIKNGN